MKHSITMDEILLSLRSLAPHYRTEVPLTEWAGLPVHVDPSVPKGQIQLRDKHGAVVKVFEWPDGAKN